MAAPTGWAYDTVVDKLCGLEDIDRITLGDAVGEGSASRRRASVEAARASETVEDFHAFMNALKEGGASTASTTAATSTDSGGAEANGVGETIANGVNGVASPVNKADSDEDPLPPVPPPTEVDGAASAVEAAVVMRNAAQPPSGGERRNSMERPARPSIRPNRTPSVVASDAPPRTRADSVPAKPGRPPSALQPAKPPVRVSVSGGPARPQRPKSIVVPPRSPAMARRLAELMPSGGTAASTSGHPSPTAGRAVPTPGHPSPTAGRAAPTQGRPSPTPGRMNPGFGLVPGVTSKTSPVVGRPAPKTPPPKRKPLLAPPPKPTSPPKPVDAFTQAMVNTASTASDAAPRSDSVPSEPEPSMATESDSVPSEPEPCMATEAEVVSATAIVVETEIAPVGDNGEFRVLTLTHILFFCALESGVSIKHQRDVLIPSVHISACICVASHCHLLTTK